MAEERRTGSDRRQGDPRRGSAGTYTGPERRRNGDRRAGWDRREESAGGEQ